ncbi:hypothetical protein, partial [Mycoplasma marinum]
FIGYELYVPSEQFKASFEESIGFEVRPMYGDEPMHIEAFDANLSSYEYDEKLKIANSATPDETINIFVVNDYYSLGGVTEYNKYLVDTILKAGYKKINWIYTMTNNKVAVKKVIDPRINQIFMPLARGRGLFSSIKNILTVKITLSNILKKNPAKKLILNPYFSYMVLSKKVAKKQKSIISI